MYMCVNRKRLNFHPTSSEHAVYDKSKAVSLWPRYKVSLEWADGQYVLIDDDSQLRFASRLISDGLYCDAKAFAEDFRRREALVDKHFAAPDSDQDDTLHSDDDITLDEFYRMGYKHEADLEW
jgi:hypothetical protein